MNANKCYMLKKLSFDDLHAIVESVCVETVNEKNRFSIRIETGRMT